MIIFLDFLYMIERLEVTVTCDRSVRGVEEVARDEKRVTELRGRLVTAAKGTENLMPLFIECVENDVTLGEICNTLRGVWGEYVAQGF
ncbi:MAG: hypothetical protein HYZ22_06195 [Chloroflexi bacterium]|nr:hypothetical protein [Chloroflexota bacterium]